MSVQIQLRRDTLANWTAVNPILAEGEQSYVTDGSPTQKIKIGDGVTAWLSLPYFAGAGGGGTWGSITGTLSSQTDLQSALDGKVDENASITGATKTKITYDAKGLVTAGADATTADIADSTNKRYVTDAELAAIGTTSFPLLAPNGSVTAPSYAFSETGNDTGLYHTGDGNMSVAVNGNRKASFDPSSITFDVDINVTGKQYVYQSIADLLNEDPAIKIDKAVSNTANVTGQYAAGLGSAVLVSDAFNHTNSFYLGAVGEVRYQSAECASAICGGVQGSVDYNSTGTLFAGIGLSANVVNNNATGVITGAVGVLSEIANDGGGGVTTGYNFRVDKNEATTAWGFYCDQDIKHFLGGETRFGGTNDASPPAKIDTSGNAEVNSIKVGSDPAQYNLNSGTYTPTLTNVTNVSASTAYKCQWLRVGNTVTVSGKIDIDSTSPGALEVGVSLPVASNFANEEDCAGTGTEVTASPDPLWIKADATNNRASFNQNNTDITNHSHYFTFTYEVI